MNKGFIILLALFLLPASAFGQQEMQKDSGPVLERNRALDAEIGDLIKKLSSVNWRTREAATRRLTEIGEPALGALAAAHETDDIEVRDRIERLLDKFHWVSPEKQARIEKIISEYSSGSKQKKKVDVDGLVKELSSENDKVREEAAKALAGAGLPALPALKRLSGSGDESQKELANKITNEILSAAGRREMKIVEHLRQVKYCAFYLFRQLSGASAGPQRQNRIAELLSGVLGLKSPSVRMVGGEILINGFSFPRPPGGIVVSKSGGKVILNGMEICVPGMIMEGITPAEVIARTAANRSLDAQTRQCALEAFAERKEKKAVGQLINAMKRENESFQSLIVDALSQVVKGGPQNRDTQNVKDSVLAWQKWWKQQNAPGEMIKPGRKNRRGSKNRQRRGGKK